MRDEAWIWEQIKDDRLQNMLRELSELLCQVYGSKLKAVILYGSVARGTQTEGSDIDIMVLVDGDDDVLRSFWDKLSDVSTEMALKYLEVFSIIDVSYQEYNDWKMVSPFYRNVSEEGVVLYAA
ncbi:MAG: nucleotidyltransferase domain-containing protein [Lachnospiraceae bacterium]|nr:nucleotidyltransferase domain-containing protein [Lachnospiraceae bacterium]